jgi:hypothetical protein
VDRAFLEVMGIAPPEKEAVLAAGRQAPPAGGTGTATRGERHQHSIPDAEPGDTRTHCDDLTHCLVAGDDAGAGSLAAFVRMEVGAAQARALDGDDGVGRVLDRWIRKVAVVLDPFWTLEEQAAHSGRIPPG